MVNKIYEELSKKKVQTDESHKERTQVAEAISTMKGDVIFLPKDVIVNFYF
jgi:hypothetical protein